jgi:hypothetical protein
VEQIEHYTSVVWQACQERDLADLKAYDRAVASVLKSVAQRGAYLATTALLGGEKSSPG